MEEIRKAIQQRREDLKKAVYSNTYQNKKLGRVGQNYGGKKEPDSTADGKIKRGDSISGLIMGSDYVVDRVKGEVLLGRFVNTMNGKKGIQTVIVPIEEVLKREGRGLAISRSEAKKEDVQMVNAVKLTLSDSIPGDWQSDGGGFFTLETGDRGARQDHSNIDGESWMDSDEIASNRKPFADKWASRIEAAKKNVKSRRGIDVDIEVSYGEKGHVSLVARIKQ